jgi:hypothetical protein
MECLHKGMTGQMTYDEVLNDADWQVEMVSAVVEAIGREDNEDSREYHPGPPYRSTLEIIRIMTLTLASNSSSPRDLSRIYGSPVTSFGRHSPFAGGTPNQGNTPIQTTGRTARSEEICARSPRRSWGATMLAKGVFRWNKSGVSVASIPYLIFNHH